MRLLSLLILLLPVAAIAQNELWMSKIDPKLWAYAQNPDTTVEFLIIMQEQADVSPAQQLTKKEDKGRFVFETLSAFAEQTQRNVRDLLHNEDVPTQSFWIINGLWAKGSKSLMEQVAQLPEVGRLELNPVWHLSQPPQVEHPVAEDRLNAMSWGLTKINADDVWNLGYTGAGIVIGGQDTGYEWAHPALKNKYRGWDGSTVDHNYNWHDAIHAVINGGTNSCGLNLDHPCDDHYHGTHTMGTMVGGTSADSTFGVAPDAKWMGCRDMEEGDGTPATYTECFQWFVAPTNLLNQNPDSGKAPHVINNSWGCPPSEGCDAGAIAAMEIVVNNVRAAGIVVVVSAGNDGPNCSTVNSPAAIYNSSYSVGATDSNDNIAGFSSRGPVTVYTAIMKPDISAPGVGILSSYGHDNQSSNYSYTTLNGTSMAGPHIAGVVALILNARPSLIGNVDAVENVINVTAVPKFDTAPFCGSDNGSSRPNNVFGWGRVDALAAVNSALPVELLQFNAKPNGTSVLLQWITGSESDCSHFSVQRSADGFTWLRVGELPCKGTGTPANIQYNFTDASPFKGLNYYRLEQVDYSGKSNFSPIRVLSMSPTGYTLRIGSGSGKAYYEVVGEDARDITWQLEICALDGRVLQRRAIGSKGTLETPELASGIYLAVLRDVNGNAVATEKWMWSK